MIRAGVIGYGLGGMAFHAPLIDAVPELELTAIATSKVEAVHERYPGMRVTDAESLIADPEISLVAISTPNDTHFPLAKAALEAGKHVVIDKPFANTAEQGEELIALATARGLVLSAFHNRRWDSDFLTVRRLIEGGRLGEVMLYEAHWDRFRPALAQAWKESPGAGAGQLPDLGTHLIDQMLLLFGMPEALTADLANQREDSRVEDYFALTFHYGERRVVLTSSRLIAAPRPRFSIHGTKASFVKYGLDPQEPWLRDGGKPSDAGYGMEDATIHGVLTPGDGEGDTIASERGDYRAFYSGLARAIAGEGPVPVDPADAVAGLRLIEAARESAREGRTMAL
jgi:scyllo-inositol 2-dehydrogenase (NADP+)